MNAPHTSHDAAQQLHELSGVLDTRRREAVRLRAVRDAAEHLYRREQAKARLQAEGRNADDRASAVELHPLTAEVQVEGLTVARRLWSDAYDEAPTTVGDLRWLRDRAEGMAEGTSAAAYDARDRMRAWQSVVGFAKSEAELGPQVRGVA